MKALLALPILAGLVAAALLLWWDSFDGTRFTRTMEDVSSLLPDDVKRGVTDPWGNHYVRFEAISDGYSSSYIFSKGPDGLSRSLGHDPDDINPSTRRSVWLADLHGVPWIREVLYMSIGYTLALCGIAATRRNTQKDRTPPQK